MNIPFSKYQGTGNDFILLDQRSIKWIDVSDQKLIEKMCDRRFGIGADGLILLENSDKFAFRMIYFNADGNQSTMCGNGGRCIVKFAQQKGLFSDSCSFDAIDGEHLAKIDLIKPDIISLQMKDVHKILNPEKDVYILNTGSPHFVKFVDSMPENVSRAGKAIRYTEEFKAEGINVNFVVVLQNSLSIATYERGVEDETLSCGTGVTAAVLAYAKAYSKYEGTIKALTKGGELSVQFKSNEDGFRDIWLIGPAVHVFDGVYKSN
ncbi:MAG: diaminopimelate epimerase [Saprospiraceae bacterium]|nr:diaminopimelate epimerase [Saprospiraceae bacterium]